MTVPESREVLEQALADPNLPGWHEATGNPFFANRTYWWARINNLGIYLGVMPEGWSGKPGHPWFITQGYDGDPDDEPTTLIQGHAATPEEARTEATMWYNERRKQIQVRKR